MNLFNAGTKIASTLGLASIVIEAHSMGKTASRKTAGQVSADKYVQDSIAASKMNTTSVKHNASKKFLEHSDMVDRIYTTGGKIGGYIKGFASCLWNNIFTVAFGTIALAAKSKTANAIALAGMGISMLYDFIVNGTNLFERKDYLDK